MKRILLLLLAVIAVTGGLFAYDRYVSRSIEAQLMKDTAAIVQGYSTLMDTSVLPLEATHAFTQKQTEAVAHMKSARAVIAQEETVAGTVSLINSMQLALMAFLRDLQPQQPFAESPEVATIQREMGESGEMRLLLEAYNKTAKRWNDHFGNLVGSVSSLMPGKTNALLPYLRFDGEQEYLTTIHL